MVELFESGKIHPASKYLASTPMASPFSLAHAHDDMTTDVQIEHGIESSVIWHFWFGNISNTLI